MNEPTHTYETEHTNIGEQILSRASSADITHYNQIECLFDSVENFPAWEEALNNAEESILIEMYIFADDAFGKKIRDILIEKSKQGLHVILVYDWFGSIKQHYTGFFKPLIQAGATVCCYNHIFFSKGLGLFSRNHRKMIIVDRKIAFVSGLCFSSNWEGNPDKNIPPWRDTGVCMQGPVVLQAIEAFKETLKSQGLTFPVKLENTPPICAAGNVSARLVAGKPDSGNMMRLDLLIISMAEATLWITDAYFMATSVYLTLLKNAAQDGVDVRLLVPKTSDIPWIGAVSRTQYRTLLRAGVRIFEWNGPMIHAKSCVADGHWARIGSTNLNISSWLANREIDITIQDKKVSELLQKKFLEDLTNATEVVLNEHEIAELVVKRPKKANLIRAKASAAARQAARLGGYLRGDIRTTGKPEDMALLSLGLFAIVLAIALLFFPRIIAVPLAIFLMIIGTTLIINVRSKLKNKNTTVTQNDVQQPSDQDE